MASVTREMALVGRTCHVTHAENGLTYRGKVVGTESAGHVTVEYSVLHDTHTISFRIAADTSGGGGVKFDPKPKGGSAAEGGAGAAAAAAAEIQQQMCDLAVKDVRDSQKQSRQKQQKPAKPVHMYTSAFLDQKIAEQQQTVERLTSIGGSDLYDAQEILRQLIQKRREAPSAAPSNAAAAAFAAVPAAAEVVEDPHSRLALVYKHVFPFYSRDQFEREIARLGRQLEVAQQRIAAHLQEDAAAKAHADDQMRKLQHRLMQKAQSRQKKMEAVAARLHAASQ